MGFAQHFRSTTCWVFFDLTPTFYGGFLLKIAEPSIVMSPAFRAANAHTEARRKRYNDLVQRVLKSGVRFSIGSDMCWFYPGKIRGQASTATFVYAVQMKRFEDLEVQVGLRR